MTKPTMMQIRDAYPALALAVEASQRDPFDLENAAWLDGPEFVKWLRSNGLQPDTLLGDTIARHIRRWASGDFVFLGLADEVCTRLGHNLHHLPNTVWRERPRSRGRMVEINVRDAAVAAYNGGMTASQVAEEYGVGERSVRRWAGETRAKAA